MSRKFTEKDFKSNDGMSTGVWGPALWHFLHTMSFNYPVKPSEKDQRHYREYMETLENILPCKKCRENLKKNYKAIGFRKKKHFKNRKNFSLMIYNLHEEVNRTLGKVSNLSYADVRQMYENFRSSCPPKDSTHKGCYNINNRKQCVITIVPMGQSGNQKITIDPKCFSKDSRKRRGSKKKRSPKKSKKRSKSRKKKAGK